MRSILEHCAAARRERLEPGAILLEEQERTGRLFVLIEGHVEVLRGNTQIALIKEPGSIFGEMSILLNLPHTATVKAQSAVEVHVFDEAPRFLRSDPEIAFLIAKLLAQRLNAATTYLVDLKRQFADQNNHLEMVGEVLESLVHQQYEEVKPGSDRDPGL